MNYSRDKLIEIIKNIIGKEIQYKNNLYSEFDSMDLINLALSIEKKIFNIFNINICYQDENGIFNKKMFKTIDSIVDCTEHLIIEYFLPIKKIIITDLDNTMWGGIIGDVGLNNIYLNSYFLEYQKTLLELKNSGYILAICSKNDEKIALSGFNLSDSLLKPDDFVFFRINRNDKLQNIIEILNQANLGYSSAIFVDDSSFERERVSQLEGVLCVKNFNDIIIKKEITNADKNRTQLYLYERERQNIKNTMSYDNWLRSLGLKLKIVNVDENFKRILQIFNRTNQMNFSNIKCDTNSLRTWIEHDTVLAFNASDKFGDYGVIAVVLISNRAIYHFCMSCRAMDRKIEHFIVNYLIDKDLIDNNCLFEKFIKSELNIPMQKFIDSYKYIPIDFIEIENE